MELVKFQKNKETTRRAKANPPVRPREVVVNEVSDGSGVAGPFRERSD
ncbi:hypothetical protein SAMN05421858_0763 [Haladaptatus litoreus]|uniref:Uncharacterized protein n=1 Tax=Haladaptatus litoreus TaxID=553468 RepID=A0A1N6WKH9_9EURY|nr:hypothetical protein [Haladaptatus litoreus]SIQ90561.1 hypothetical protein SAMN05421858_0763 [Haladaptatus litoreus]